MGNHSIQKRPRMKSLLIISLAIVAANAAYIKSTPKHALRRMPGIHSKIVGGTDAYHGEFPYQASWQSSSHFNSCGGSILNENHVLTAAHCCEGVSSSYDIVGGEHIRNKDDGSEQRMEIRRRITHPDYDDNNVDNDVCVLELEGTFSFDTYVAPVSLDTIGGQSEGDHFTVTGWGTTSSGGSTSNILQKVSVPFVTPESCKNSYGSNDITDGMICAGEKGKDSCQGDSGGPMVDSAGKQVGVVSWGIGCALAGYPGVYARVSTYADWISSTAKL